MDWIIWVGVFLAGYCAGAAPTSPGRTDTTPEWNVSMEHTHGGE